MEFSKGIKNYYDILDPVIKGLGFSIVELSASEKNDGLYIILVVFSDKGVSIDDCAKVHRLSAARMEVVLGRRDIYLEVSSPGVGRNFKTADEFKVFTGKKIKVLTYDGGRWIAGTLLSAGADHIFIEVDKDSSNINENNKREIAYSDIKKARLDFSREET